MAFIKGSLNKSSVASGERQKRFIQRFLKVVLLCSAFVVRMCFLYQNAMLVFPHVYGLPVENAAEFLKQRIALLEKDLDLFRICAKSGIAILTDFLYNDQYCDALNGKVLLF